MGIWIVNIQIANFYLLRIQMAADWMVWTISNHGKNFGNQTPFSYQTFYILIANYSGDPKTGHVRFSNGQP